MFDISFKKNYICRVKEHNAIKYFLLHLPFHKMSKRQYAKLFILMLTVNKAVSLLIRLFLAKKKKNPFIGFAATHIKSGPTIILL